MKTIERFLGWPPLAVVWKDVVLETRTKDTVVSVFVFALLVIVVFNFALNPTPQSVGLVAPGILWVAFTFGGVLGLTRTFAVEKERGGMQGMLLTPVGRDEIYLGKVLSIFVLMIAVEVVTFPIFAVIYDLPLLAPGFIPVAVLATVGIAAVGTLFSAMAVNTRAREVMLPLLFLPIAVPVVVAAVEASGPALASDPWGGALPWLPILAVYDAVFLVVCSLAFGYVVQD
ncbi:MAG: heme exporter protein CcmB [Dehalococcoidia bacterium]|nr:heme exporter protein CcmB [Dehalococcoidia bacterium]